MTSLKVLFMLVGICGIVATNGEENLTDPCAIEDLECVNKQNEEFLKVTSAGIPKYNIKPIDPMSVPDMVVPVNDELKFELKKNQINGFQNEKITDFKLDKTGKFMTFNAKENVNIAGEVIEEYLKLGKTLTGRYSLIAGALVAVRLEYDMKTDDKGVRYMIVGKDTITCEATNAQVTLDPKMAQAIKDDAEITELGDTYGEKTADMTNKIACDIILAGYPTIMENFREFAKAMPVTSFFSNI